MSSSQGWVLHSAGRKFGPMSEDDLRHYFRAGMVKSVDRITAPGDFAMRTAADVAGQLGETPPVGPPPPPIDADAPVMHAHAPDAAMAVATPDIPGTTSPAAGERQLDQRAMEAIARMQMEMAAQRAPADRKRSGWLGPALIVVGLVAMMFVALNMLKKMKPGADGASGIASTQQVPPNMADGAGAAASMPANVGTRPAVPPNAPGDVPAPLTGDPEFGAAFQRADLLKNARQWPDLVTHAKNWAQKQPERAEPWHYLGIAQSAQGDFNGAADSFQHVLQADPTNVTVQEALADVYLGAGRPAEAVALYSKLATADAHNARMWNNYGMALRSTGQAVQAAAALETAVRLEPSFKQAWMNLGQTYQELGDGSKAAAAFANAK